MRYLAWEPPPRERVVQQVEAAIGGYSRWPGFGHWAAEDREGRFMGWFALTVDEDDPTAPDLGYRLRPGFWGRGLATEGSRALIDHAFGFPAVRRVVADTMFVNLPSRRVMEKCGMRHVKTYHQHFDDPLPGTELGEVLYAITREDWLRHRR
jgi:RimJ/RimL family protein N-acetyltransferase